MARCHISKLDKSKIDPGGFVSVTTVARHLNCSQSKVYGMIACRKLTGYVIDGMKRIKAEDLLDYIDINAVRI